MDLKISNFSLGSLLWMDLKISNFLQHVVNLFCHTSSHRFDLKWGCLPALKIWVIQFSSEHLENPYDRFNFSPFWLLVYDSDLNWMHARPIHPHQRKELPNIFGLTWLVSVAYIMRRSLYTTSRLTSRSRFIGSWLVYLQKIDSVYLNEPFMLALTKVFPFITGHYRNSIHTIPVVWITLTYAIKIEYSRNTVWDVGMHSNHHTLCQPLLPI